MFFFGDFTSMFLLIPAMLFAFYAQSRVLSAYTAGAGVMASNYLNCAHIARQLLRLLLLRNRRR